MGRLDLDAARAARDAARAEAKAETHELVFKGQAFELPVELPYAVAEALQESDARRALAELLGEEHGRTFFELRPSSKDMEAFAAGLVELYRTSPGESLASVSSLPNGSSPSRPTSSATTA